MPHIPQPLFSLHGGTGSLLSHMTWPQSANIPGSWVITRKKASQESCPTSTARQYGGQIIILLQHRDLKVCLWARHHLTSPDYQREERSVMTTPTTVLIQNWEHPEHMHTAFHVMMVLTANQKSKRKQYSWLYFLFLWVSHFCFSLSTYPGDQSISLRCEH